MKTVVLEDYKEKCPRCGSEDYSGSRVRAEAGIAWQDLTCDKCGAEWCEGWQFSFAEMYVEDDVEFSTSGSPISLPGKGD